MVSILTTFVVCLVTFCFKEHAHVFGMSSVCGFLMLISYQSVSDYQCVKTISLYVLRVPIVTPLWCSFLIVHFQHCSLPWYQMKVMVSQLKALGFTLLPVHGDMFSCLLYTEIYPYASARWKQETFFSVQNRLAVVPGVWCYMAGVNPFMTDGS